jgi:galactokinase
MNTQDLQAKARQAYYARFQAYPEIIVRAPGRVNLIGEHTDYNDGFVLPIAIDRAAWVAASPREDARATVRALDMNNDEKGFAVGETPSSPGGWADYPAGVAWALQDADYELVGINAVLTSDVPVGSGLSSSAAIEVAFAYTWDQLGGLGIPLADLALLCQKAENDYVGVNCGIMDQMISACGQAGHAMMLDTRDMDRGYFSMPEGIAVVVADSKVRRSLSTSAYNTRRSQCEEAVRVLQTHDPEIKALRDVSLEALNAHRDEMSDVVYRRARHVVTENARVLAFSRKLYDGDLTDVGALLVKGHRSLRDDYEVSIPELDTLVEAAVEVEGCYGARLTGAGFGGCIIALAAEDAVPDVEAHLNEVYEAEYGKQPAVYITRPADGVTRMA